MRRSILRFLRMLSFACLGMADGLLDPLGPHGRWITIRRKDGATVTAWLDPDDAGSIGRFLDTVRVPEPRASKERP